MESLERIDCLVCSFCFCFIGSIELQIGRRLYLQELGASDNHDFDMETYPYTSKDCREADSSYDEDNSLRKNNKDPGECTSGSSKAKTVLPDGIVESLMNGPLTLPYSKEFSFPQAVPCPGGCGEAYYCSISCAEADWGMSHSLLCSGERSDPVCRKALLKFTQLANETNDIFS